MGVTSDGKGGEQTKREFHTYRDAANLNPSIGLTRKNADVLYWMVKQFMLLKEQGKANVIALEWETNVRLLADAFINPHNGNTRVSLRALKGFKRIHLDKGAAVISGGCCTHFYWLLQPPELAPAATETGCSSQFNRITTRSGTIMPAG